MSNTSNSACGQMWAMLLDQHVNVGDNRVRGHFHSSKNEAAHLGDFFVDLSSYYKIAKNR